MKWLRWIGISLVSLTGLLAVVGIALFTAGGCKLGRKLTVAVHPIEVPSDSSSIAEGARLFSVYLCADCHGPQLAGTVLVDDPLLGRLIAPQLAPGRGSATADYTDEHWIRAIRHGIGGDGRPLVVMPSIDFANISEPDLAKIVAYTKQVPAVDQALPKTQFRLAQIMIGAGLFPLDYDRIDHSKPPPGKPASSDALASGKYLSMVCSGCHGADFMGNEEFGGPQLARGGVFDAYDEVKFRTMLATGVAADGRALDPKVMPWKGLGQMTAEEQHAIWAYLKTVPATPAK